MGIHGRLRLLKYILPPWVKIAGWALALLIALALFVHLASRGTSFSVVVSAANADSTPALTRLEKEMLRRAGMFAFCGEWPWDSDGEDPKTEREQAALRSAILKLR